MTRPCHPLWFALAAPAAWALHFLASYVSVALACAKWPEGIGAARLLVGAYTLAAFAVYGLIVRRTLRRPHCGDERFLRQLTLALAGLSAIATIYSMLPAAWFGSCR